MQSGTKDPQEGSCRPRGEGAKGLKPNLKAPPNNTSDGI